MIYLSNHALSYILSGALNQIVFGQQMVNNEDLKIHTIAIIALILVFYGVSVGINITGFALFLNQQGFTKMQIGHILSMELAGNLMIAPILPKISEYFGIFKVMLVALIVRSLCLIMFAENASISQHMMWLFGFGVSGFSLFASVQYWGASTAQGPHKSTIISLFNVAFGLGIACGIVFLLFRPEEISSELFYISVLFSAVIFIPILFSRHLMPSEAEKVLHIAPSKIIQFGQVPILCGLVANYILLAIGNFIVLYAMDNGIAYKDAIMINMYMIAGNILLTIPIGVVLDKFNKTASLVVILIMASCAIAAIPFVMTSKMMTIVVFITISAATGGIYVVGLSMLTDKFRTQNLAMANIVMLMMNAIGGFAGVSATGAAIGYWGHQGLIISLFVLVFFFMLFVVYSLNGKE